MSEAISYFVLSILSIVACFIIGYCAGSLFSETRKQRDKIMERIDERRKDWRKWDDTWQW